MCPRGARAFAGHGSLLGTAEIVCHCLLIEAGGELVLVDTGIGTEDVANPKRLGQPFRAAIAPVCDIEETAVRRVEALGFDPADVRQIVTTHLDLDHAGGLGDFPNAQVHVFGAELAAAKAPPLRERLRYVPEQWAHGPNWVEHEVAGDSWFGFEKVRLLPDLDAEIAMVPLAGHSPGHVGVAVQDGDGWLLHCGDAFFFRGEVETPHRCPVGFRLFQNITQYDGKARHHNQERLRELAREHGDEVTLINAHDPVTLERARAERAA